MNNLAETTATRLVPRSGLTSDDLNRMHALLSEYFDGVTFTQFQQDLAEKNWVILIERSARLVGFTTLLAYELTYENEPLSVIYSGDTLVAPGKHGTPRQCQARVDRIGGHVAAALSARTAFTGFSSRPGFDRYRFLPLFWREFYPQHSSPTPEPSKMLLDFIATDKFGSQYDPASGIVRLKHPQAPSLSLAHIPPGRCTDPHVAFFTRSGIRIMPDGDELVCRSTELFSANLTPPSRRMAAAMHPDGDRGAAQTARRSWSTAPTNFTFSRAARWIWAPPKNESFCAESRG